MNTVYVVTFSENNPINVWGDMTAVFSSMEKAIQYVEREINRLGKNFPYGIRHKGGDWMEYYFYNHVGYEVSKVFALIQEYEIDIELED